MENTELMELQRRLHDLHESSDRLRNRIGELERERDEARRIARAYRVVWEQVSAAVDTCPNPDPLPWDLFPANDQGHLSQPGASVTATERTESHGN